MIRFFFLIIVGFGIQSCSDSHSKVSYVYKTGGQPGVAAKAGDIEISSTEIEKGLVLELYEKEKEIFRLKESKLKELLIKKIIAADPKGKGLSVEEYLQRNVVSKAKVTQKEIDTFVKEQKIPTTHMNDQFKNQIKAYLKNQKEREVIDAWLGKKIGKPVEVFFQKPARPQFTMPAIGDSPVYGDEKSPVAIYEYSDFQCPHCAQAVSIIDKIKKKYKGKVKIVYKNFPLPNHPDARKASLAAMCVHEQNKAKFWDFHAKVFENQRFLSDDKLKLYAKPLGIDEAKFTACLESKKYDSLITKDIEEGSKLGIRSTPTFFVNGKIVTGAQSVEVFEEIIKESL